MDFTEQDSADAVAASFANTPDPRLREVMTSLVGHLHGFLRDVRPSLSEWEQAIEFLTATGQTCSDTRQEFIMLSDVLGTSMLVETMEATRQAEDATASTVLGPFHVVDSPARELGDNIDLVGGGELCLVRGQVLSSDGTPLLSSTVDVWQADENDFYDVQIPDEQPLGNGRGLFTTDEHGLFWFRTVVPAHYPIPTDGPVGKLLTTTGRHPYRPAHIHFIAEAKDHVPVTTHVFVADSPYIASDAVFAVKTILIRRFDHTDEPETAAAHGLPNPFRCASFDIVLQPVSPPERHTGPSRAAGRGLPSVPTCLSL